MQFIEELKMVGPSRKIRGKVVNFKKKKSEQDSHATCKHVTFSVGPFGKLWSAYDHGSASALYLCHHPGEL